MSRRKVRTSSRSHSTDARKMASPSPGVANLTALLQNTTTGSATIIRCPGDILSRLRQAGGADHITLFTPVVPHPPSTLLAKNMDPFEPLGRALSRHVRHIPYRQEIGMTETHCNFLSSTGVIIVVVCTTEHVLSYNPQAFQQQSKFARDIVEKVEEDDADIPVIVLLITNGGRRPAHEEGLKDMPALFTCNNYTTSALENIVRVILGV